MNRIYRDTYAEINLSNLYSNFLSVKSRIGNKKIIPVVKANAYGHGVLNVVKHLISKEIDYFAVSTLEEALEIRSEFQNVDILVMGVVQSTYFNDASKNNITLSISNEDQLLGLETLSSKLKVHIKIDSGMNRLGFKSDIEIKNAMNLLKESENVQIQGIFTHFSTADCDEEYYNVQLGRFKSILEELNFDFKMIHVSNSSSSIKFEHNLAFTTHVRLGISLYGLTLDEETTFLKNTYKLISKFNNFIVNYWVGNVENIKWNFAISIDIRKSK